MSSPPRAPLKRRRSPSPDDRQKPTRPRPERKKPKLMTGGKPSATKRRLLQLLQRQKKTVTTYNPPRNLQDHLRSRDNLVATRTRLISKLRNERWHPYPARQDKRVYEFGIRGVKIQVPPKGQPKSRALVQMQKLSSAQGLRSKEIRFMDFTSQVDDLPSGQPTTPLSGEIKSTDSVALVNPKEAPASGKKSSGDCEPDDVYTHQDLVTTKESTDLIAGVINLNSCQPEMHTIDGIDGDFTESVLLPSTDGDTAMPVNPNIASSGADRPLSNENHSPPNSAHDPGLALSPKQLGDPRHDATEAVISGSPSQIAGDDHLSVIFDPPAFHAPSSNASDHVDVTSGETIPVDNVPGPHGLSSKLIIATSSSQLQHVDAIVDAAQPEVLPDFLLNNQDVDLVALNSPVDVVSNSVLNHDGIRCASFLFNDPAPPPRMNSSVPIDIVDLHFPFPTTTPQAEPDKDLDAVVLNVRDSPPPTSILLSVSGDQDGNSNSFSPVPFAHKSQLMDFLQVTEPQQMAVIQPKDISGPGDTPQIQMAAVFRSADVQATDPPQPLSALQPQSHEPQLPIYRPTDIPRNMDSHQGTPQYMDVDMLSDIDVDSSESDGYTSDSDENRSTQILKSVTYRRLKAQPHDQCCNGTLANIVEMLAKAKSPRPRLPKGLREQGQPRQYDVSRENNQLKTCVREYSHHLLGQMPWDVPSESELLAFENGRGTGPTPTSFRLDLASQGLSSKWNAQAAEVFADAFLGDVELATEFSDRDAILTAFIVHLTTLQKRYRQPILRAKMTEAELHGERDKQKQRAREQRKRGLFRRRINATKDYKTDPLLNALLTSFWLYCTPEVMSDDETDSEWDGPVDRMSHFIKITNWRNPDVVNFFRVLDALYFSTRFKGNKWSPGRFPHTRVPSLRLTECDAVPGLPVNFYRPQWLSQLNDIERRKLKMRPAINLDFSQEILRIAARFLHIRHRKQLPLPRDHPALQTITRSSFPSGFPLENPLRQTSNEEVLLTRTTNAPQPSTPSATDPFAMQQIGATTKSLLTSQGDAPSISVELASSNTPFNPISSSSQPMASESTPQGIMFTRLPTSHPFSESNSILLTPAALVGLPEGESGRPQIYLVNQPLDGPAPAGSSSLKPHASQGVPMQSGHIVPVGFIPRSSNGTYNWNLSTLDAGQKRAERFTLAKHPRRFIKKSVKGKEKAF